jgi:hypothetical protein
VPRTITAGKLVGKSIVLTPFIDMNILARNNYFSNPYA